EDVPATVRLPRHPDLWVPWVLPDRGPGIVGVVARLRPGATRVAFQGELAAATRAFEKQLGDRLRGQELPYALRAVPIREQATRRIRPAVVLLVVAATLVLLVAMGNVTGVGVARGEARAGDLAVRMALGSGRRGVAALIATESLILAALVALGGTGLAAALARLVRVAAPDGMPGVDRLHVPLPLVGLAVAMSMAGAGCLALGSVARVRGWRLGDVLRGSRDAGARGTRRAGLALVSVELAATLVLLSGSIVLVRSVMGLLSVDPGFDPRGVLTAEITLPETRYPDAARARAVQRALPAEGADPPVPRFHRALVERLENEPDLAAAAAAYPLPFGGSQESSVYWIDGQAPFDELALVDYTVVSEGYFRALGIPLLRGRGFARADRHGSQPVVVVSASLAERFPHGEALGRRMKLGGAPDAPYPWLRVVGVVPDVKRTDLIQPARPEMYVHVSQGGYTSLSTSRLVVRVAEDRGPGSVVSTVRAALAELDPDIPLEDVRPMEALLAEATSRVRFTTRLVAGFTMLALLITVLGLYSAVSYAATSRRRELAVRVALGASSGEVLRTVLGESLAALLVGLGIGAVGVYLTSGLLRGLVYGVPPFEPVSLLAAAAVLCGAVVLAAQGPARTALRIAPARVLARD
ncbi:MAG: ABC transporter permease, partial [Gemmatimonadota bacterium]